MIPRIRSFPRRHRAILAALGRVLLVVAALLILQSARAYAGTDTTFDDLNTMMTDWTKGSLGKAFALIALLLGIGVAAARQSFGALFGGIGVAAAASVGPTVVSQVLTAVF
jgi:conjugal transfer pilus assembly protein TraA